MSNKEIPRLIEQANLAHETGQIDREIDLRLQAFALSEGLVSRPIEEIEKAAHLICDLGDELEDPSSEKQWQQATRHAKSRHDIIEEAIVGLVRAEHPERAFAITQRVKSPSLVRRLRAHTRARADLSPIAVQYGNVLTKKDVVQHRLRQAQREDQPEERMRELVSQSKEVQEELRLIEMRLREEDPEALAGFGAPLEPDDLLPLFPPDGSGCLVDLHLASREGIALLAFRDGLHVKMVGVLAADLDRRLFLEESRKWFRARDSGHPDRMIEALRSLSKFLHDRLMCGLGQFLRRRGHWQVTIIPHLMTHAMPLHLAPLCWTGDLELFYERFAVTYAPCVQLALATGLRPRPVEFIRGKLPAFLLADPKEDLPGARLEQRKIQEQLAKHPWPAAPVPQYSVVGRSARLDATLEKLPEAGVIALATHATFIGGDPYGSGLYLAAGGKRKLKLWTVDEIYASSHLKKSPVVVLSACESGMSHFDESSEIVALPPAFVCIGAAAVLGTLWPVEDLSTSFLVERFTYHLLDPGETPATALGEACKDIRRVSREEALDRCDEIQSQMEERGAPLKTGEEAHSQLEETRKRIVSGPDHPFESPLVWGGFFITGCGWRSGGGKAVASREPRATAAMAEGTAKVQNAAALFGQGKYEETVTLLREAIPTLDGLWLGRALLLLGDSLYRLPMQKRLFDLEYSRRQAEEALRTLNRAYEILEAQGDKEASSHCVDLIKTIKSELRSQG